MSIYLVIGSPGSGKGTFADYLKEKGCEHLSTGDLLRNEVKNETPIGLQYASYILGHEAIPNGDAIVQDLVKKKLAEAIEKKRDIVLDGFPKTVSQCEFIDQLQQKVVVVYLEVDPKIAIDRIAYRKTCNRCDQIYNSKHSPSKVPDKCDKCEGDLFARPDFTLEGAKKRVYSYEKIISPVLDYYIKTDRLNKIDVNGSIESCVEKFSIFYRNIKMHFVSVL